MESAIVPSHDVAAPGRLKAVLVVCALAVALMLPALWNGYPILYFDTVDYISLGFSWKLPVYRTAGYGFIALTSWVAGTVWATLVLQSLVTAYVLYAGWRLLLPQLRGWKLAGVLVLTFVLTSLPWVTSTIMPDVFTGPAILLTLILALRATSLSLLQRIVMVVLLGVACVSHPTHVAVIAGLIVCILVMSWLARHNWPFVRMQTGLPLAGLLLGLALSLATNSAVTGRIFFAPRTTPVLTLAVLMEHGITQRYLADTCGKSGERQSILCPYRNRLPNEANEFLWHDHDFGRVGGWNALMPDAARDLEEIIKRYPLDFALAATQLFAEQLVVVRTGEGFRTMVGFADKQLREFYPRDYPRFLAAHQQHYPEIWDSPIPAINLVQVPAMLAGVAALVVCLIVAWRRRDHLAVTLATLVLLAYAGNAFICGAISNPADRYGTRLAWLATLTALALLPRLMRSGGREKSSAAG